MTVAIGSDAKTYLTDWVIEEIKKRGHQIKLFGALVPNASPHSCRWPKVAHEVAREVAQNLAEQGVLFCWTGTGISIAANKIAGIRAALCVDAETARGARLWNDANILTLSLRLTSVEVAREILNAWFSTPASVEPEDLDALAYLKTIEPQ